LFAALLHRDFRVWWASFVAAQLSLQLQQFAIGWLVVLIAVGAGTPERAALFLGMLGLAHAIPAIVLGLSAGVIVDRIDRRTLLIASDCAFGLISLALGLATLAGSLTLWPVLVAGALYSAVSVVYVPTRNAIQPRLVGDRDLKSAVGLNVIVLNTTSFVGPLLGGILVVPFGVGSVLTASGLGLLIVAGVLLLLSPYPVAGKRTRGSLQAVVDGLSYVRSSSLLFWLFVGYGGALFLANPIGDLLPAFVRQVLGQGPVALSWLFAAIGIGSLMSGLVVATVHRLQADPRAMLGALAIAGILLAVFTRQHDLVPALVLAVGWGFMMTFAGASINLTVQTTTPDHLRGRVNSLLNLLVEAGTPLGTLTLGVVGTALGVDAALMGAGLLLVVVSAWVGTRPLLVSSNVAVAAAGTDSIGSVS
jgi:predicted MFS family arabinose efflux permease